MAEVSGDTTGIGLAWAVPTANSVGGADKWRRPQAPPPPPDGAPQTSPTPAPGSGQQQ